ncbi:hypothetical protein MTO96_001368 [Rhipicephalus appendiculatus]
MQCAVAEQCSQPCLDKSLFARHDDGIPLQAQGHVLFSGSLSGPDRAVFGTRLLACHPAARSGGAHDMRRPQRPPCSDLEEVHVHRESRVYDEGGCPLT